MSYRPQALASLVATGWVVPPLLSSYHPTPSTLSLPQYSWCHPARQAYSHSASLGRRYCFPVLAFSFRIYSCVSFQLTLSAGQLLPQSLVKKPLKWLGLLPMMARHCPCVTSVLPIANALAMVTRCIGDSCSALEPMSKLPAG